MTYDRINLSKLVEESKPLLEDSGLMPRVTDFLPEIPEKLIRSCCGLFTPTMSEVTKIVGDKLPERLFEILSADTTDATIVNEVIEDFKADIVAAFARCMEKRDRLKREVREAAERERRDALASIPETVRQNLHKFAESLNDPAKYDDDDVNIVMCSAQVKNLEKRRGQNDDS